MSRDEGRRAVAALRRRTLGRATRGYVTWVGRAVGWWTIVYLVFWLAVFAVSAVQSLPPLDPPLPAVVPSALAGLAALAFTALGAVGRTPSVTLDRRDLYRLALAPLEPYAVLRGRLRARRALAAATGGLVGLAWTLVAPAWAATAAPWAAPALALAAVAWTDLAWLRYAGFRRPDAVGTTARRATLATGAAVAAAAVAGALLGVTVDPAWTALGPAGGVATEHPLALVAPALLALVTHRAVRRSLANAWPPRFAPQSLVLTQLQAMRTFRLIAGAAGLPTGREADAIERDRLLATLHDRPDAVRPRRSLRPPPADAPRWRAIAWRAASAWVRRHGWRRAVSLATTLGAAAAAWAVADATAVSGPVATETGFVAAGDGLGLGVLLAGAVLGTAWFAAAAWGPWLGPSLPAATLPVEPAARTGGRVAPGGAMLALSLGLTAGVGALVGIVPTVAAAVSAAVLLATVGVVLEKYGTWSGVGPRAWEAQLVAALAAAAPAMLAAAFGAPALAPIGAALVLTVAWLLPV